MVETQTNSIGNLIEPEPITFTFGAPGWYVLTGLILIAGLVYAIRAFLDYKRNRYRRLALKTLVNIRNSEGPYHYHLYRTVELCKRVSITAYGRKLANLNGMAWINFLEDRNPGQPYFSKDTIDLVTKGIYQGKKAKLSSQNLTDLHSDIIYWIKGHRV